MEAIGLNRFSRKALVILSVFALGTVFTGYFGAPQPDEGAAAHVFQLTIVLLALSAFLFLATANWREPLRSLRPLLAPAAVLIMSFVALYYLEHVFYAAQPR